MIVAVAATADEVAGVRSRLSLDGVSVMELDETRRLVMAPVDDEGAAWRLAAALRDEGLAAVSRPESGGRLEAWRRETRPMTFGDRLTVCHACSDHDRAGLPGLIELGPGGFGTGRHAATRLVIEEMISRLTPGARVLDVGCGSGILGLCARELGADRVVGCDIDPEAVMATRRNAARNGMADAVTAMADPVGEIGGEFDVVVANIARAAAVELAPDLVRRVAPGGWLLVSGLSPGQCEQVAGYLRPLVEVGRRVAGEWAAIVLGRPGPLFGW